MTNVTVNGTPYSDDGSTANDMQNGGFRAHLLPMVSDTLIDTAGKVAAAAAQVTLAAAQVALANSAAASAAVAASTAVSGPGSNGSSTTSLTVGLGAQSLTIQTGKTLSVGMPCTIASTASPRNWMNGSIDSYNSATGALVVFVTNIGLVTPGTFPTLAAWTISLSGPAAQTGVLNEQKGSAIASASTINLDTATGNYLHLTGSVGVATVTLAQGSEREVTLDAAPLLTNSANLILPTAANVQGAAGDVLRFRGEGSGVVRVTSWVRATGLPLITSGSVVMTVSGVFNPVPGASYYMVDLDAGGASGTANFGSGSGAGGGGAGERIQRIFPASVISAPVTVTIGSGGASVSSTGTVALGNNGGNTSFGSLLVAHGGQAPAAAYSGGNGGGILVYASATGQMGASGAQTSSSAEWGGGSGGCINAGTGANYPGGSSINGPGGGGAVGNAVTGVSSTSAGGSSGSYSTGGGGAAGTSGSPNGIAGANATSLSTSGQGGGATWYSGTNTVGGAGGFPGGGGGAAIATAGTATSGPGNNGVARIYWW